MNITIGFYAKFSIKMASFIKMGPFPNSATLGGFGGKMAAPGWRRKLEGAAWCQNVRTNILVTELKNGAPSALRLSNFRLRGVVPPPLPLKRLDLQILKANKLLINDILSIKHNEIKIILLFKIHKGQIYGIINRHEFDFLIRPANFLHAIWLH